MVDRRTALAATCLVMAGIAGCESPREAPPATPPAVHAAASPARGDVTRGRELLARFECNRCHEGTGLAPPPPERRCAGCHLDIVAGRMEAPPEVLAGWQSRVHSLIDVPSLAGARRLERAWIAQFLLAPRDLRPHLDATMPRLALSEEQAWDLAAALSPAPSPDREIAGDAERGRALLRERPCGLCHTLGGESLASSGDPGLAGDAFARARRLAPDLAHARERMSAAALVEWLVDPRAQDPETPMPPTQLSRAQASDVARYLLEAPVTAVARAVPPRLPVLDREVTFAELDAALFHAVCWHCHADPSFALGDGGPGKSGGFGFAPRGLDLSSYEGLRSGALDDAGRRRSVFGEVELPSGERLPRIVAVLRARQLEEAGRPVESLRGMPLGLPSVAPETIQLLETWIAQGRRH